MNHSIQAVYIYRFYNVSFIQPNFGTIEFDIHVSRALNILLSDVNLHSIRSR